MSCGDGCAEALVSSRTREARVGATLRSPTSVAQQIPTARTPAAG